MRTVLLIILAFILPPLAAFFVVGIRPHFWINILLTILGWFPGTVHAIWLIASPPSTAAA